MTGDGLGGGLDAVGDDDVAAGPAKQFKEGRFAGELADLGVNHLTAGEVDASAHFTTLDADGAGGGDAAFHLD